MLKSVAYFQGDDSEELFQGIWASEATATEEVLYQVLGIQSLWYAT